MILLYNEFRLKMFYGDANLNLWMKEKNIKITK